MKAAHDSFIPSSFFGSRPGSHFFQSGSAALGLLVFGRRRIEDLLHPLAQTDHLEALETGPPRS